MTQQLIIQLIADFAVVPVVLIGGFALVFYVPKGQRFQAYARILMAGLTAYLLAKLVAIVYQPSAERPFQTMGIEPGASYLDNPGFPSDHALFVTAILAAVWFETKRKNISLILGVLVVLVCVGRVAAFVHTPLDVFGGVAIALIGALWYLQKPVEKRGDHGSGNRRR